MPPPMPTLAKEDFVAHVAAWAAERGQVIDTTPGSAIDYLCSLLAGDRAIMGRLCDDVDRARARVAAGSSKPSGGADGG